MYNQNVDDRYMWKYLKTFNGLTRYDCLRIVNNLNCCTDMKKIRDFLTAKSFNDLISPPFFNVAVYLSKDILHELIKIVQEKYSKILDVLDIRRK